MFLNYLFKKEAHNYKILQVYKRMSFYNYEKDGVIIRPVAADFMKLELILEEEKENEEPLWGTVYDIEEEQPLSNKKKQALHRRSDINNLRKFLEGKYVFEEGETLAAFDEVECEREAVCLIVFGYIQSLEDYHHVFSNWSLDDASLWALDIADWHFGVLNAAEIFMVVNMMLENMCKE